MKKIFSLVILCAFLLSSCNLKPTVSSSSNAGNNESSSVSQPAQVSPLVKSFLTANADGSLVASSREGIAELYIDEKISPQAYDFFDYFLSGGDYNYSFSVPEFQLTYNEKAYKESYVLNFDFTIENSQLETLPNGKYEKDFHDIRYLYLTDRGVLEEKTQNKFSDIPEVKMLANWFSSVYSYDTPTVLKPSGDYSRYVNFICNYYKKDPMPVAEFKQLVEKHFGVKPYEHTADEFGGLLINDNGVEAVQAGGIGGSTSYTVTNYREEADKNVVTVQFYGDDIRIKPSHVIDYSFGKNGEFYGYEIIKASLYAPAWLGKSIYGVRDSFSRKLSFEEFKQQYPYMAALAVCDVDTLVEHPSKRFTAEMAEAADKFTAASVTEIYSDEYGENAVALLDITDSSNPNFQVRKDNYIIYDSMQLSIMQYSSLYKELSAAQKMLAAYFECMESSNYTLSIKPEDTCTADFVLHRLFHLYPSKKGFTVQEVQEYALKYLDIKDMVVPEVYYSGNQDGLCTYLARCGRNIVYDFTVTKGTGEFPEITVQFYADYSKLVRSDEICYTLQLIDGEYKIIKAEMLTKSKF